MTATIRKATIADTPTIFRFICDLAEFEKAADQVETSVQQLEETVFGPDAVVDALICEENGERSPSRSGTTPSPPGRAAPASISKTSMLPRPPAAAASERWS
jgi:hypothetical protein